MSQETNNHVARLPYEVRQRTYNFAGALKALSAAEIDNSTHSYFTRSSNTEAHIATMQGILSDMGFREFRLLGAGRMSLVFDTTFDQLLRISFQKPERAITDSAGVAAITLQPFEEHTIRELGNIHISILPHVEMKGVTRKDEETVLCALQNCGRRAIDVVEHGNVGFITRKNRPKLKGNIPALPDDFPEKLPVLIDTDFLRIFDAISTRRLDSVVKLYSPTMRCILFGLQRGMTRYFLHNAWRYRAIS